MIKPFGKHFLVKKAKRNGGVSADTQNVSRAIARNRQRQKKRLYTVATIVAASVMVPIMISSAATGNMNLIPNRTAEESESSNVSVAVNDTDAASAASSEEQKTEPAVSANANSDLSGQTAPAPAEGGESLVAVGEAEELGEDPSGQAMLAEAPTADPEPAYMTLTEGVSHDSVHALQQRLMDLYYMGSDETTDYFGPQTAAAIRYFQRKHGLNVDGAAGPETQKLLFSDDAKEYTMSLGAEGADVWNLQERLSELGYNVSITGYFGAETEAAVKYFQRMSGLDEDGSVGHLTQELIYSENAEKSLEYGQEPADDPEENGDTDNGGSEDRNDESGGNDSDNEEKPSSGEESGSDEESRPEPEEERQPDPEPEEEKSSGGGTSYQQDPGSVEAFIAVAEAQLGKPYTLGGKGPDTFDCSGLIYYCLKESGNSVGYMTSGGWRNSDFPTVTSIGDLQRGDIICMSGHVAIYLGDGMVLDASSSQNAMVERAFGSWFRNGFICAKRPL